MGDGARLGNMVRSKYAWYLVMLDTHSTPVPLVSEQVLSRLKQVFFSSCDVGGSYATRMIPARIIYAIR